MNAADSSAMNTGDAWRVTLQPAGKSFAARPEETILAAGERAGLRLPAGCRDGACGTCKCRVLTGQADMPGQRFSALSAQEARAGWILACQARSLSDLTIEIQADLDAEPPRIFPCRVQRIEKMPGDVAILRLQLPASASSGKAMTWRAGQYIDFLLPGGVRRSYSIACAPHGEPWLEIHVRHMPGGVFTDQVFGSMKEKDLLRIQGPLGAFYLRAGSRPLIFLASGTGFAPIQAILEQMQREGDARPVHLYWGGRREVELYAQQRAQALCAQFTPVLSEQNWAGRTGLVHEAVMQDYADLSGFDVYACGAPVMVNAARRDFTAHCRLPEGAFYADAFLSQADRAQKPTP